MTDTGLLNSTGRAVLAIGVILFCCVIIVMLLRYGDHANSLHSSALAWSYALIAAVMAALGIGAVIPALVAPKTP